MDAEKSGSAGGRPLADILNCWREARQTAVACRRGVTLSSNGAERINGIKNPSGFHTVSDIALDDLLNSA